MFVHLFVGTHKNSLFISLWWCHKLLSTLLHFIHAWNWNVFFIITQQQQHNQLSVYICEIVYQVRVWGNKKGILFISVHMKLCVNLSWKDFFCLFIGFLERGSDLKDLKFYRLNLFKKPNGCGGKNYISWVFNKFLLLQLSSQLTYCAHSHRKVLCNEEKFCYLFSRSLSLTPTLHKRLAETN